ncbi:MAG: hypothetical protein H6Q91_972 [Deltaproteobacteria bacterium]|nr:hypothetical protein [Deltaproteobacteria bacterium]
MLSLLQPEENPVRRLGPCLGMIVFASTLAIGGCGGDEGDRGLAVPNEVSTPESAKDEAETTQQRQQQVTEEMQRKQIEDFDAANAAKQQEEKPAQ